MSRVYLSQCIQEAFLLPKPLVKISSAFPTQENRCNGFNHGNVFAVSKRNISGPTTFKILG